MFRKNGKEEIAALREEVAALREGLDRLRDELRALRQKVEPEPMVRCNVGLIRTMQSRGINLATLAKKSGVDSGVIRGFISTRYYLHPEETEALSRALGGFCDVKGGLTDSEICATLGEIPVGYTEPEPAPDSSADAEEDAARSQVQRIANCLPSAVMRMRAAGITLEELATRSGLSIPHVRAIILAQGFEPTPEEKEAIAAALGMSAGAAFQRGGVDPEILAAVLNAKPQPASASA